MSEKVNISNFFLILAIVVIIIMGFVIYKLYNDSQASNLRVEALKEELSISENTIKDLQNKVNNLQGTIDNVSKALNPDASNSEEKNISSLKVGNYTVNEVKEDEAGISNEECGVKLKENNDFEIYMGWGTWHTGKYEIKDGNLICKSTLFKWENGEDGSRKTDVVFIFKIVNSNKLELTSIDVKDKNTEKLIYNDGLTIGMTYSVK